MSLEFKEDPLLSGAEFLDLVQRVWPGEYSLEHTQCALLVTRNFTARDQGRLIGCVRLLSDGYFFGTIPEILVDPVYQRRGVGRRLMEQAWESSPTSLFFGAQAGNEGFFEKLGYERSMSSFVRKKPRRS
jgi:ribosomal protein S18 acetylase RimI-like enzyme